MQPILVFMSKVDGSFKFSPVSVNFLTEVTKVLFAVIMLLLQVCLLTKYLFLSVHFFYFFIFCASILLGYKFSIPYMSVNQSLFTP